MDLNDLQERNSRIDNILQISMALAGVSIASPLLIMIFFGVEVSGFWSAYSMVVLLSLLVMVLSAPLIYNRIRRWALDQVANSLERIVKVERSYSLFSNKLVLSMCGIYYSPFVHSKYSASPASFRIEFKDIVLGSGHLDLQEYHKSERTWKVRSKEWKPEVSSGFVKMFTEYAKKDMLVTSLGSGKDKVMVELRLGRFDEHQLLEFIYEVGSFLDVASNGYMKTKSPEQGSDVPARRPVRDGLSYRI